MTAHARRYGEEPNAATDPRDAMLDLFETSVRTLQAIGLEYPMTARFTRLTGTPVTGKPVADAPAPPPPAAAPAPPFEPPDELALVNVLAGLRKAPATPQVIAARIYVSKLLDQAKTRRTTP